MCSQPAPVSGTGDMWKNVIDKVRDESYLRQTNPDQPDDVVMAYIRLGNECEDRRAFGQEKYGTPLQADNGRDPIQDALEEALDLMVYLEQAIVQEADEETFKMLATLQSFSMGVSAAVVSIIMKKEHNEQTK